MRYHAFPLAIAFAAGLASDGYAQDPDIVLEPDTLVALVTDQELSSKVNVKGDLVALRTADDVCINGLVAIPRGTKAVGQVSDARAKGAMGMSGRLVIRPLYLRVGNVVIRLSGAMTGKGEVAAGAVIGMIALTPGFTGRSAVIPAGTPLSSVVERRAILGTIAPTDRKCCG